MSLTSKQKQFEEDFARGFKQGLEEGKHRMASVIAKRMLAMRNDPEIIKHAIHFYIKEMTGLSYKEIEKLETLRNISLI